MFNSELMNSDVAIEIIAEMIADVSFKIENTTDEKVLQELNNKRELYKKQRNEIYSGNKDTINYVNEVYGSELKKQR